MSRPQVVGFVPVLFEPRQDDGQPGRVWFFHHVGFPLDDSTTLYSYAGEPGKWIERKPQRSFFSFEKPGVMVRNTRFFFEQNLVHVFDGTDWSVHEVGTKEQFRSVDHAKLFPEPDGKGLVIPIHATNPLELWRWHRGVWRKHVMPQPEESQGWTLEYCVGHGGMWMTDHRGLWFSPFLEKDEPPPKLKLAQRFGPYNYNPEYRGLWFIQSLPDGRVVLGARELWQDSEENDTRFAEARRIQEKIKSIIEKTYRQTRDTRRMTREVFDLSGGVAVRNPDGIFQLIRGARLLGGWKPRILFSGRESGPILTPQGLWANGDNIYYPPCLLDFEQGRVVDELPDPSMTYLHAVDEEGTVYASNRVSPTIMAYGPGAPSNIVSVRLDDRLTLSTKLDRCWVADDGRVWARDLAGQMVRFDGRSWQSVAQLKGTTMEYVVLGSENVALGQTDAGEWLLMQDDFVAQSPSVLELIKDNRHRVTAGFRGRLHRGSADLRLCVAVDANDHIWVSVAGEDGVHVLVGDGWEDAGQSLNAADAERPIEAFVIANLGDGVYINGQTDWSTGVPAFLARVKDGKVVLEEQAEVLRMSSRRLTASRRPISYRWEADVWHDRNDGVWIPAFAAAGRDSASRDAVYVTSKGEQQRFRMGRPLFVGENGEVWLTSMEENEWQHAVVHIWHDGKIRQTLVVPGLAASQCVFSTKPDVVWAFTGGGIRRLVHNGAPDDINYEVDQNVYVLRDVQFDPLSERIRQVAYSALGYFVTVCTDNDQDDAHRVQLIPVPNADAQ